MPTIQINFFTNTINKKQYEIAILHYLTRHFYHKDTEKYNELNKWMINIRDAKTTDLSKFSGVKGEHTHKHFSVKTK